MEIPLLSAEDIEQALPPAEAARAIVEALRSGVDPAADPPRAVLGTARGQLLLMPSEAAAGLGVKVVTIAPDNPAAGLPRIQALYLLFHPVTLAPLALLDGAALTTLRTPAVSVAAVRPALLRDEEPLRVVVFGTGPQASAHLHTLAGSLAGRRRLGAVTVVARSPEHSGRVLAARPSAEVLPAGSAEVADRLAGAGLVVCATTARTPLFDSRALAPGCVVVAVGSHEPDAREVDSALAARAQVIVEDVATALREAGDVVRPIAEGALDPASLVPLRDVVTGAVPLADDRPVLFKSTGMAWEDLAVAQAVLAAHRPATATTPP